MTNAALEDIIRINQATIAVFYFSLARDYNNDYTETIYITLTYLDRRQTCMTDGTLAICGCYFMKLC